MAIEVGDAVLKFIGDSTQLDTKFAEVGPNAEKAFGQAATAVEEGTGRMKSSIGEARGEAALLGEAFGVHLPRHVRSFIAELPGVGKALSAAFSATAILFVANAVVEVSKKLSDALAEFIYAKSVWDETNKSVVSLNTELLSLGKQYEALKKEADDYGKSALQLAAENKGAVKESITDLNKTLHDEVEQFKALEQAEIKHATTRLSATAAWQAYKSDNLGALQALKAFTFGIETASLKHKEHDEIENKILITNQKLKNAHEELRVATNHVSTAQDDLNKKGAALQLQIEKTAAELTKLNNEINHTKVNASQVEIVTPAQIQLILNGVAAAHNYGIVLRGDLVQALREANKAEIDFANSGIKDDVARKQFAANIKLAKKALDDYGKSVDTFKIKSRGLWAEFRDDTKAGATAMDHTKQIGVLAFDSLSKGLEGAVASAILAQTSFAQAMEKALASALANIAGQALVKSLFYGAEGFAALAAQDYSGADQYFIAAAEMAAVGAVAGVAGHALAGAGSGGGSVQNQQNHNSQSNTSSQAGTTTRPVGVQGFATGGLISAPTLAIIGEQSKREAVLPLDDPHAMQAIRKGIGVDGNGGTHVHVNVAGHVIGAADIVHLTKQISKAVNNGRTTLTSSNTLRVTKRSA